MCTVELCWQLWHNYPDTYSFSLTGNFPCGKLCVNAHVFVDVEKEKNVKNMNITEQTSRLQETSQLQRLGSTGRYVAQCRPLVDALGANTAN